MMDATSGEPLASRLRRAVPEAIKARDQVSVAALRSALGAIENATAVPPGEAPRASGTIAGAHVGVGAAEAERLVLSEDQIVVIVEAEVRERCAVAATYERAGHAERAARLVAEADILRAHLRAHTRR